MNIIFKLLLLGFFSIALYACNLIPSVDEESLPNTARIGIVSLMYDYMDYLNFSGIPIYSFKSSSHYVAKWKLNEFAVSATKKHLKDRFDIIDVSYSPTILKRGFMIYETIQITNGATAGYVLTSDASGNGS